MTSHGVLGWGSAALMAALVALSGCSDDTSLLIRIARDPAVPSFANIPEVELFVGLTSTVDSQDGTQWYAGDPDPEQRVPTAGRDLSEQPLTLLLTPNERLPGDAELFIVAIGRKDADIVALGTIEDEQGEPRRVAFQSDKVVVWDVVLRPLVQSEVEVSPLGCLEWTSRDGRVVVSAPDDLDCDKSSNADDCKPEDPAIHPNATDDCTTDIDEDCDGNPRNPTDRDRDGVTNCAGDCNDQNPNVFPDAPPRCDGVDNDCRPDTICNPDDDEDGYTVCGKAFRENGVWVCQLSSNVGERCDRDELCDCEEGNDLVSPGAPERCDGVANDCRTDTACDPDPDGDGYTVCGTIRWMDNPRRSSCEVGCVPGQVGEVCDCDVDDGSAGGPLPEVCDGLDNGCDTQRYPARTPCFIEPDGPTGMCFSGERICDDMDRVTPLEACGANRDAGAVDDAFCVRYGECEMQHPTDPYRCMRSDSSEQRCIVDVSASAPCQPATVNLPPAGIVNATCEWRILGGRTQGPWAVGIKPRDQDVPLSDRVVGECNVTFAVEKLSQDVPDGDQHRIALLRRSATVADVIEVVLTVDTVSQCVTPGMKCTSAGPTPL